MPENFDHNQEEHNDLRTDVALVKRDVKLIFEFFGKIDITIEKLQELTSQMTTMLRLHEERIEKKFREDEVLKTLIETKYDKIEQSMNAMDKRVTRLTNWRRLTMFVVSGILAVTLFIGSKIAGNLIDSRMHPTPSVIEQVVPPVLNRK